MESPLILLTNDDGIDATGLWATAEALAPLGDLLVIAPEIQWSGAGRSIPHNITGRVTALTHEIAGRPQTVYAIDGTPALAVVHGILELAPRRPALIVSGINFGENVGTQVTISGTVGAALEGAAYQIPSLAVSLQMAPEYHLTGRLDTNYRTAQVFTRQFARLLLERTFPYDVDLLNLNIPWEATPETPWTLTRLSRINYFVYEMPDQEASAQHPGYRERDDFSQVEPGSDVWALRIAQQVSVTPLSLDMTSRADFGALEEHLKRN